MESVSKRGEQRLYPPITDPNFLVLRSRRQIFKAWSSELNGSQLTALDVGCRYQPYRPLFEGRVNCYIGVDLFKTDLVTVVGDGEALPFAPESFDLVIATQVLESFRNPHKAALQINTVLKPGGVFLASVAAFAPRLVGDERWRFLPSGVRTLLEPFSTVEIVPELDSLCSMVRTVNLALDMFVRFKIARKVYRLSVCPVLNLLGLALGKLRLTANDQFTANFSVRAVKGL
jgi:SAM-dependent methyltransferase